ncbi:S-layer homology domain-containing protein [Paenibacillus rigui]|uniref:SLH domain-containing protein n=1 Tax=Paenibacillus rigui TaxID=554312 RepID=A0A229UWS7_9BACL|nr:S-layer homology domain-containing protein [Paenibacillus rigui]OXM87957.1 hypothetical protein CF651_02325 [Paenibacillus rigui]
MKKHIAWSLSFLLVAMSLLPAAYAAEEADGAVATEIKADTNESATQVVKPDVASQISDSEVKLSENYSDLTGLPEDLKEKFDFFIRRGVFVPESENTFGPDNLITREEFVKAAKAGFTSTSDEALTNPELIKSFETLGLINPDGGVIDYEDNLNRQDLAKYLVYALGKVNEARNVTPIVDLSIANEDRVDKTSARFVTYALQLKIMQNQDDGRFHGSDRKVTRRMLVESVYDAMNVMSDLKDTAKVSIEEVKPVGAKKVSVTFNRTLDSEKMEKIILAVKKEGTAFSTTSSWSDDQKTVILTLDQKLIKGSYSVELSGLAETVMDKKTAEFTAEDEQISKLEFTNTSGELPRGKVIVDFKQLNQYGEQTDLGAHRFEIRAGSKLSPQNITGKQAFRLNLSDEKRGSAISISIFDREHNMSANKVFTVGDRVMVSKVDFGDVTFKEKKKYLQPGDKVYLAFTAYDQYGNRLDDTETLNKDMLISYDGEQLFEDRGDIVFFDNDYDGYPEIELEALTDIEKDTSATLRLMSAGSGHIATKDFSMVTPKVPASIEIKDLSSSVIAEGDVNIPVELAIRDAEGYEFSPDERVELFKAGKIKVRSSSALKLGSIIGGEEGPIELSGANKGNIRILEVTGKGKESIEVSVDNVSQRATAEYTVENKRLPAVLEKSGFEPSQTYTVIQEAKRGVQPQFIVKDQYDTSYKGIKNDEYQIEYKWEKLSGDTGAFTGTFSGSPAFKLDDTNNIARRTVMDANEKNINMAPDSIKKGTYQVTATLVKAKKDPSISDPTKWPIETRMNSIVAKAKMYTWKEMDADDDELKYYLNADTSLFAVGKFMVDSGLKVNKNEKDKNPIADETDAANIFKNKSDFTKGLSISAKNKDGNETVIPTAQITSMSFADSRIVAVDKKDSPTKMVGLNPGSTSANIVFKTPNGQKSINVNFTVFSSDLTFSELKFGKTSLIPKLTELDGYYIWDTKIANGIRIIDDMNNAFINSADKSQNKNSESLTPFLGRFGATLTLSDVTYLAGTTEANKDTFYMTDDYKLVFKPKSGSYTSGKINLQSFKINGTGPDKRTVTLTVTLK